MIFVLIAVLLLITPALAANLAEEIAVVNQQIVGQPIPSQLGMLLGNQRINIEIGLDNGEKLNLGIITENNLVKSAALAKITDPTLEISIDQATLEEIAQQQGSPVPTLVRAMKENRLKYRAIGFFNKLKFSFGSLFLKLGNLFAEEEVVGEGKAKDEKKNEPPTPTLNQPPEEEVEDKGGEETNDEEGEDLETPTGAVVRETEKEKVHTIELTGEGFPIKEIIIKAGDTVVWENSRSGKIIKAMIIGARNCREVKSRIFEPGNSFSYTFEEAQTCTLIDGIFTTETMKVIVE